MRRDVFQAIADPTRRAIIALLAEERMNLNAVAERFDISRPAISKHIKILSQCGIIDIFQEGRERFCEANFKKLHEVAEWLKPYKKFWKHNFNEAEEYSDFKESEKKSKGKKKKKDKDKKKKK